MEPESHWGKVMAAEVSHREPSPAARSSEQRQGVSLIGFGAIGQVVAAELLSDPEGPRLVAVLVRSRMDEARAHLPQEVEVVSSLEELKALRPSLVAECAGQAALLQFTPDLLSSGINVIAVSTGVLASPGLLEEWKRLACAGRARLLIPAGAIAGLDGLGAHRRAGLTRVIYTSTKPPLAWRGSPAEDVVDLEDLAERVTIFDGPAREAALRFPKNANLAATVAIAGLGFDATRVRLVADPAAEGNSGRIEAESAIGRLLVEMSGKASANPKTSESTGYSVANAIASYAAPIVI